MKMSERDGLDHGDRCTATGFALPSFGIVMKVGPHSGMSLAEIVETKHEEEAMHGVHYWGYSGTLCHPKRVVRFVQYVLSQQPTPPDLLLLETVSPYSSPIGGIKCFSRDSNAYEEFNAPVQLQGAEYAFVCRDLCRLDHDILLDSYQVVGGKNDGERLSKHLRFRVNKAFVRRSYGPASSHLARLAYRAELVEPYVLWLGA